MKNFYIVPKCTEDCTSVSSASRVKEVSSFNFSFLLVSFMLLFGSVNLGYSQGATCSAATAITLNGSCASGTISDTTIDAGTPALGCTGTFNREGWYSFTISGAVYLSIVAEITVTNRNLMLQLISSTGSCSGLSEVACVNSVNSNSAQIETIVTTLTTGTYYLRVMNVGTSGTMALSSLCIRSVPANNECFAATALTVNPNATCTASTSSTSIGATQSAAGCTGSADDDVWFSFVATQGQHTVTVTPGTMTDVVFQAYSGNCSGLLSLTCRNNTSGSSAENYTLTDLTMGNTYYVRVYSNGTTTSAGTFSICVTSPTITYSAPTSFSPSTLYINNVSFTAANTVTNSSTYSTGYQDFSGITKPTQEQGGTITISVTSNVSGRIKAWIDWNRDGDFDDSGEQIYDTTSGVTSTSPPISFTIPINVVTGDYRIRFRNRYNDIYLIATWLGPYFDDFNSSDNFTQNVVLFRNFGEAEDYVFTVTPTCKKSFVGTDGVWETASNWSPNGVPTASSCITIDNKTVTIAANYAAYGKNIDIKNASSLNVLSTGSLVITDNVTVSANSLMQLQDSASLVQITDVNNASANNNSGSISMVRVAQPMYRYDYTYWSSPVAGMTSYGLSPLTLNDKYYNWNAPGQYWELDYFGDDVMLAGKGYIIRAPQNFPLNPATTSVFTGTFQGKPNNGTVAVSITGSTTVDKWNLIGNPYPSAIDIEKFLLANNTVLDGTIYLWTHNTPVNNLVYASGDYATYNFTGSLGTGFGDNAPTEPNSVVNTPTKYIGAGQSFFAKGIANGTTTANFKNTMRETANNMQFFRPSMQETMMSPISQHKVWLNLTNDQGAFSQTLVGYIPEATNGLDWGFDGDLFGGNYVAFYSIESGRNLAIQGRALPFQASDEVPLGFMTTLSGDFNIAIDHLYDFEDRDIFLEDKETDTLHNLKLGAYTFAATAGTYNERFVLKYSANINLDVPSLQIEKPIVYKDHENSIVVKSGISELHRISIYDVTGRSVYDKTGINTNEISINNITMAKQFLIVNVVTTDGKMSSQKLIY